MLKVIVDRTRWLRGEKGNSYLLREKDQRMCCLGFAFKACGVDDSLILDWSDPSTILTRSAEDYPEPLNNLVDFVSKLDTEIGNQLMNINDQDSIEDSDREKQIIELGKEAEIEFEFIN